MHVFIVCFFNYHKTIKLKHIFCSGKIVSPKWKSFKGLRLLWRDKIRLNNAIWRAWFIQCESAVIHQLSLLLLLSCLLLPSDTDKKSVMYMWV